MTGAQVVVLCTLCMLLSSFLSRGLKLQHQFHRSHRIFQSHSVTRSFRTSMSMSAPQPYLAVHVRGKLVDKTYDEFYQATLTNARNSILEPGISRFDVLRNVQRPEEFLLIEVYKTSSDPDKHKLTQHYKDWRVTVEPHMAAPRAAAKYTPLYPAQSLLDTAERSSQEDTAQYQQHRPWLAQPFQVDSTAGQSIKGGLLACLADITVSTGRAADFVALTKELCQHSTKQSGVHRVDFLSSNANTGAASGTSNFLLVTMFNSPQARTQYEQSAQVRQWTAAVTPLLASPAPASTEPAMRTDEFMTLFPSPLHYHAHSALTHIAEGQAALQSRSHPAESAWSGRRGLGTTNLAAGMFGFQGPKILMGRGIAATAIKDTLKSLRLRRPLLVTGQGGLQRQAHLWEAAFTGLADPAGVAYDYAANAVTVAGEPTVEDAQRITAFAVAQGCDSVLAVGGGSALDIGKAVAALVPNSHRDIFDFLEVIGKGQALDHDPLPLIAVPTTSGTGSEATKNAVLKSVAHGLKVSIRHDKMYPVVAVLDPLLTLSCPPAVTAHVGMDTLCQCLEPFLCCVPNPFVDALAREGISRAARALRDAVADGARNIEAREDMAVASVMGGLCLANAKLGAVHGFAAVLGGRFEHAPHGALCAVLLPYVFQKNAQVLQQIAEGGDRESNSSLLESPARLDAVVKLARFREAAAMITGNPQATIADGAAWLLALMRDISIPSLGALCPELAALVAAAEGGDAGAAEALQGIVTATMNASSTKGNPVVLSREQLKEVLLQAMKCGAQH